jgi:hypothetical protein
MTLMTPRASAAGNAGRTNLEAATERQRAQRPTVVGMAGER